ncbi:hypothetical protein [Methanococcoides methylutens]|nr:hypothetical protein [Methanococcoides methylutens]
MFEDPTIEKQTVPEEEDHDKENEEESPLSFLVTLACLGSAFILMKKK